MESEINTVFIELPTFRSTDPEAWFLHAESQFRIHGVSDDFTMYNYVVISLDEETASRVAHILINPPVGAMYLILKNYLIRIFSLSRRERAARLLDMNGLDNRKPSALLADIKALAGEHTSCMLLQEIFLRQMPNHIRFQLVKEDLNELDAMAKRADEIFHVSLEDLDVNPTKKIV